MFVATSGRRKPARYLQIGMAIKSLTDCRNVIITLNPITKAEIEELEIEMTYICYNAYNITAVMSNEKTSSTGLAFGNYDGLKKTLCMTMLEK